MINILPITRVIGVIAVCYGVFVAAIIALNWQFDTVTTFRSSVGIALSGATGLNVLLLFLVTIGWKQIWSVFPILNKWVFPDLNGEWKMTIHWQSDGKSGIVPAKAYIKQDLLRIRFRNAYCAAKKRFRVGNAYLVLRLSRDAKERWARRWRFL